MLICCSSNTVQIQLFKSDNLLSLTIRIHHLIFRISRPKHSTTLHGITV